MNPADVRLQWVVRLRWAAIAAEGIIIALCRTGLGLPLPINPLSTILLVAAATQFGVWGLSRRAGGSSRGLLPAILVADTLLLTGLLYFTGGAHNPFSAFYLIQIAIAASVLGSAWTWALLCLTVTCFAGLFWYNVPMVIPAAGTGSMSAMSLHFVGMFVAMTLTGACLAWFVARLNSELREHEAARKSAELKAERESRFTSIVTLAAGVAHEINSPLATIAVAARELEHDLLTSAAPAELVPDARLIRSEVERCRRVLGRLRAASFVHGREPESFMRAGELASALRETLPASYTDRLVQVNRAEAATCRVPREPVLQAVGSLVRNAVEASPAGAPVQLEVSRDNGPIAITVSDRG
ncbi:MAG TPA: hypothetical protein VG818_00930, partial [Gemmatimonadaceae bacterium]|nr:hypothetical protein [Gemmatimonadaceae bacterium]